MKWIVLSVMLNLYQLIKAQKETHMTITNRQCGKSYNMAWYKSAYLEYRGSDTLEHNPCSVEFRNEDATEKNICVVPQQLSIDCGTKLEFHEGFVKSYYQPERKLLCYNSTLDEWCAANYVGNIFIVIRKNDVKTPDVIKLRLYRKEISKNFMTSSTGILLVTLLPAMVILAIIFCIVCYFNHRRWDAYRARRAQYRRTAEAVGLQTGQNYDISSHPVPGNQPVSAGAGPQHILSGYQMHAMSSNVPINQGNMQDESNQPLVPPSAPQIETEEAPPPSYDSLWRK